MKNKIKEFFTSEPDYDLRWLFITVVLLVLITLSTKSKAYEPFPADVITMDVTKSYGGGGTFLCPTVRDCFVYTRYAEQRGANQYCESVVIKRNGVVVWSKYFYKNKY